ncbi:ABC transporter permease [Effusibacillus pohliae]|uniref:ABC transporter permease n=1 Tax=Effusibacillus pohliae TaxID=232270 RepID=UPI000363913A|nr:ABC transporter permease [Effusibacillus pohliae]
MELIHQALQYILENQDRFLDAVMVHARLSAFALLVSILLCVPLGIFCAKNPKIETSVMNIVNSLRVVPSLAILVIVLPFLGTGFTPALVALTVLACPPVLINTFLGFRSLSPAVLEVAVGMGMEKHQILTKVEFPLALPFVIAGVRTAAVEVIASATLAAFIGGGGLGTFIVNGLGMYDFSLLLVGAIPVATLAILSEACFAGVERWITMYQRD